MDESTRSMSRRRYVTTFGAVGATALAGCVSSLFQGEDRASIEYDLSTDHNIEQWPGYDPEWTTPTTSPRVQSYSTETIIKNLEIPWDITFAPDGTLFLTERTGTLNRVSAGQVDRIVRPDDIIDAESIPPGSTVSKWFLKGGAGGMHGVAVHPEYPTVPVVYTYYTYLDEEDTKYNKVVAYDVADDRPEAGVPILDRVPAKKIHNGGRIAFGPRNFLWVTTGDASEASRAQSLTYLGGKVLRLTPTGEPAPDNPDLGADADPRIFTYGHRNPQGLTWLPDGTPIVTEHGPKHHDEVNVLTPGANYGWPRARTKEEYETFTEIHRPVVNTDDVTWAPSGSLFYTGTAVPGLRNRLLIATLRGAHLNVVTLTRPDEALPPLDGCRRFEGWYDSDFVATSHRLFEDQLGRLRAIAQDSDGGLYLATSNRDGRAGQGFPTPQDDRLLRIVPR